MLTNGYRDAGTTNIDPTLLAQLTQRTTYPPASMLTNLTGSTTLGPTVSRDTDTPDLGYHYDPIDFVVSGLQVTNNALLTLSSGVAVGIDFSAGSYGIKLDSGGGLISEGGPTNRTHIFRTHAVQELTTTTSASNGVPNIAVAYPGSTGLVVRLRFTDMPMIAGSYYHFLDVTNKGVLEEMSLRDTEVRGGTIFFSPSQSSQRIAWTNNLFDRVSATTGEYAAMTAYAFNNTFIGGSLSLTGSLGTNWIVRDNLFDKTTITENTNATISHDYNGFVTNFSRLNTPYGGHDQILTNSPDYQSFLLGWHYLPTNSPLTNAGSRTADAAELWHFTTATNQVKETNSVVDIGYHSVAVDPATGLPLDYDSDGVPDYIEDSNGNGAVDSGETDWQNGSDLGLRVRITRPTRNSSIP